MIGPLVGRSACERTCRLLSHAAASRFLRSVTRRENAALAAEHVQDITPRVGQDTGWRLPPVNDCECVCVCVCDARCGHHVSVSPSGSIYIFFFPFWGPHSKSRRYQFEILFMTLFNKFAGGISTSCKKGPFHAR